MQNIIVYTLWVSFGIQIFYFAFFYFRVFIKKNKPQGKYSNEAVSIIISAKNEYENLKLFLPKVLNQDYHTFEVVVINDASEDDTFKILNEFSEKYSNLKIINIDINSLEEGKKNALTKGINASKYEYLIFTDADCYPTSNKWVESIMNTFAEETEIVLGYGGYETDKNFLNKLIRFETVFIALKYMSFAKVGIPYMGVGRNLAYKKSTFIRNNGYDSHKHIISGDDDLFIREVANKKNTTITLNKNSFTKSIPKKKLKSFLHQKRRHLTTGIKYKILHKILLGTEVFSLLIFYLSIVFSFLLQSIGIIAYMLYFIRLILLIIILLSFSKILNEKVNTFFIPIFDVLTPIINLYSSLSNIFIKTIKWK